MALQPSGQFQFEQDRLDDGGRAAALSDQFVDAHRHQAEQVGDARAIGIARLLRRRGRVGTFGRADHAGVDGADLFEDIGRRLDQRRTLADQHVASLRARIGGVAGHRHDLAPRLARQPRGDQRAGAWRGLDHHRALRQPCDDPVARGEVAGERLRARRLLGDQQAAYGNLLLQPGIFGREGDVDTAGDDADRPALQCADMRRRVDPARQTGGDGHALRRKVLRQSACEAARRGRGVARAHQRHPAALRQPDVAA